MKEKNKRAYICCKEDKKSFYKSKWEERMGFYVSVVDDIHNATAVYVIKENGQMPEQEKSVVEISQKLGLKVHYLNQELVDEELVRDMLNGKKRDNSKTRTMSKGLEK